MEFLRDFWEWVIAVFEHWHGYVSGGIIAFALEYGEKLWEWKPPKKWIWVILGLGFFFSLFSAWREQREALRKASASIGELNSKIQGLNQKLEGRNPALGGEIEQTITANAGSNGGRAFIQVEIRNSGGSPTIAEKYLISVELPNGRVFKGIPYTITAGMEAMKFQGPNAPSKELLALGILLDNTSHPIATGGNARGWIPLEFPETKHGDELIIPGAKWVVSFADVRGKRWEIINTWTGKESKRLQYYPSTR